MRAVEREAVGERLADGLALDGTHMHPAYVNVLEEALQSF